MSGNFTPSSLSRRACGKRITVDNKSSRLPSKGRMLSVICVGLFGYALMELGGGFDLSSLSDPIRKMIGRAGMVIGYLSALVAGLSFYWDAKAQGIAARANESMRQSENAIALLKELETELGRSFELQLGKFKQQVGEAEADLSETSQYLSSKAWLGVLALVGVIVGTLFQLIGAT